MKRSMFMIIILLISLSSFSCIFEEKALEDFGNNTENKYIMVHEEPKNSLQDIFCKKFADSLYQKTKGDVEIEIITAGQFGNNKNSLNELQSGNIDFAIVSPGTTGEIIPYGQFFNLHFLFTDDLSTNQIILDESKVINEKLVKAYERYAVRPLNFWTEGFMYWSNNKKITKPNDFKGSKIRTMQSPLIIKSYEAYDANPIALSFNQVFRQLQLGHIDGQENPLWYIEQTELNLVQNYVMDSRHAMYVTSTMVNKKLYDNMSVERKIMLRESVGEATIYINNIIIEKDQIAKTNIIEEGSTIFVSAEDIDREAFRLNAEAVLQLYVEIVGEDSEIIMGELLNEIDLFETTR